jgi:hypothetical protein
MRALTYTLVGAACFCVGALYASTTRVTQDVRREALVQPAQNLLTCDKNGLQELQRICRARRKAV